MATIKSVGSSLGKNIGVDIFTWETLTENDTADPLLIGGLGSLAASVQIVGTIGGATAVLQGSNDGTNWVTLQDFEGEDISFVDSIGARDFSTAMLYIRPSFSGGSSQDVDVIVTARY